ncbi:hypothetical protein QJS04_geneDACA005746 [Acorus gramineus]|uniref:Uncharacterized protein n=1 Tax=Acorus gramineus TaxID=55184 RepID=A0AAV9BKP2_ACOGR|nr:hypothetical protein QJS04_geneDACA005746 [Acorus gramineus]
MTLGGQNSKFQEVPMTGVTFINIMGANQAKIELQEVHNTHLNPLIIDERYIKREVTLDPTTTPLQSRKYPHQSHVSQSIPTLINPSLPRHKPKGGQIRQSMKSQGQFSPIQLSPTRSVRSIGFFEFERVERREIERVIHLRGRRGAMASSPVKFLFALLLVSVVAWIIFA